MRVSVGAEIISGMDVFLRKRRLRLRAQMQCLKEREREREREDSLELWFAVSISNIIEIELGWQAGWRSGGRGE